MYLVRWLPSLFSAPASNLVGAMRRHKAQHAFKRKVMLQTKRTRFSACEPKHADLADPPVVDFVESIFIHTGL